MAILVICPECRTNQKIRPVCTRCGSKLSKNVKYRVALPLPSGKRFSQTTESLKLARKIEASQKVSILEGRYLNKKKQAPQLSKVWDLYLPWAKANKRSWKDDLERWTHHLESDLGHKSADIITVGDVEAVIARMRATVNRHGRTYQPQTIVNVITLLRRIINFGLERDLYQGENAAAKVTLPQPDNQVNNYLSKQSGPPLRLDNAWASWSMEPCMLV